MQGNSIFSPETDVKRRVPMQKLSFLPALNGEELKLAKKPLQGEPS
jgi:hypothetical protein